MIDSSSVRTQQHIANAKKTANPGATVHSRRATSLTTKSAPWLTPKAC